jgi:hypothetical protein
MNNVVLRKTRKKDKSIVMTKSLKRTAQCGNAVSSVVDPKFFFLPDPTHLKITLLMLYYAIKPSDNTTVCVQ